MNRVHAGKFKTFRHIFLQLAGYPLYIIFKTLFVKLKTSVRIILTEVLSWPRQGYFNKNNILLFLRPKSVKPCIYSKFKENRLLLQYFFSYFYCSIRTQIVTPWRPCVSI